MLIIKTVIKKAVMNTAFLSILFGFFNVSCGGSRSIDYDERNRILNENFPGSEYDENKPNYDSRDFNSMIWIYLDQGKFLRIGVFISNSKPIDSAEYFDHNSALFLNLKEKRLRRLVDLSELGQVVCEENPQPNEIFCKKLEISINLKEFPNQSGSSISLDGEFKSTLEIKSKPFKVLGSFDRFPLKPLGSFQIFETSYSLLGKSSIPDLQVSNLTEIRSSNFSLGFEVPDDRPAWLNFLKPKTRLTLPVTLEQQWTVQDYRKILVSTDADKQTLNVTVPMLNLETLEARTFKYQIQQPE